MNAQLLQLLISLGGIAVMAGLCCALFDRKETSLADVEVVTNYAGVFIVWGKMFYTFVEETEKDVPRYGFSGNIAPFNPLKVALHGWVALAGDLTRSLFAGIYAVSLRATGLVAGWQRHER